MVFEFFGYIILLFDSGGETLSSAANSNELILKLLSDSPKMELLLKSHKGVAETMAEI